MKSMKIWTITLLAAGILCQIFKAPITHYLTIPSDITAWIALVDLILYVLPFGVLLFFLFRVKGGDFRFILIPISIVLRVIAAYVAHVMYRACYTDMPDDVICVLAAAYSSFVDALLLWLLVRAVKKGQLDY